MSHRTLVNVFDQTDGLIKIEFVEWDEEDKRDIVTQFYLPPLQARRVAYQLLYKVAEQEEFE